MGRNANRPVLGARRWRVPHSPPLGPRKTMASAPSAFVVSPSSPRRGGRRRRHRHAEGRQRPRPGPPLPRSRCRRRRRPAPGAGQQRAAGRRRPGRGRPLRRCLAHGRPSPYRAASRLGRQAEGHPRPPTPAGRTQARARQPATPPPRRLAGRWGHCHGARSDTTRARVMTAASSDEPMAIRRVSESMRNPSTLSDRGASGSAVRSRGRRPAPRRRRPRGSAG